jgi:hypothetical protein
MKNATDQRGGVPRAALLCFRREEFSSSGVELAIKLCVVIMRSDKLRNSRLLLRCAATNKPAGSSGEERRRSKSCDASAVVANLLRSEGLVGLRASEPGRVARNAARQLKS